VVALRRKGDLGAKLSALAALAVAPNHLEVDQARRALAERELCPRQRQAGATIAGLGIGEVNEVVLRVVGRQEDAQHPALSLSEHGWHVRSFWRHAVSRRASNCRGFQMRSDMVPGAIFPDYELSDHTGKHRKLSEMQGQHPMVLVLSRGGYCPKDRRQAEGLIQLHREIEVGYCRLVTISTDNITETNEYRGGVGAHWPFLSDVRRIVQKDLDIAEYTDPLHNPMIPHVIVLEPGLVIYKVYNGYWFFGRPTMEDLRQDLRAVTRKCRPDWDITTPELKAAWHQGRKELFYPYGKTYIQTLGEQD
jgi:peroxiredoxin